MRKIIVKITERKSLGRKKQPVNDSKEQEPLLGPAG